MSALPLTPSQRLAKMDPADRLFRHQHRPKWGIGLWVREELTRRRLRFEDGEVRAFKKGFYEMLVPVDPEKVEVDEVFERIAAEHEVLVADREISRATKPPVMSVAEQIQVFQHDFPGGFEGETYTTALREPSEGASRKSHVGVAVAHAQQVLGKDAVQDALRDDPGALCGAAIDVLERTDLVTPSAGVRPLKALDNEARAKLGAALGTLLWGDARYRERLGGWLEALDAVGVARSWPLVTVFPALVHPDKQVAVRRRVFELQARSVKPGLVVKKIPTVQGYRKARRIAKATRRSLEQLDLKPRDLLDVRAFTWHTLRPRGVKTLEELRA